MPNDQQTNQPLDPDAVNLAKSIRLVESNNDATAVGKSGEYGAYQFMPNTWQENASKYGVNVPLKDASIDQQNQVAYGMIKSWKDQGYNPGQIASLWNSGKPDPTGNVGINKEGVNYNTPQYVDSVYSVYQQYKNGNENPTVTPTASQGQSQPQEPFLEKAAKAIGNFLFPIAGDVYHDIKGTNQKTGLQQFGDLGLSALTVLPFVGEGADAARGIVGAGDVVSDMLAKNAAGETVPDLAEKLAATKAGEAAAPDIFEKVLGNKVVQGGLLGYGTGALSNLSAGKSVGQSIMPNANTLVGAATGGITSALFPKVAGLFTRNVSQEGAINATQDALEEEVNRLKTNKNLLSNLPNGGEDALKLITLSQSLPEIEGTHFNTDAGVENLNNRISALSEARASALDKIGTRVSLDDIASDAKKNISGKEFTGQSTKMSNQIDSIISDIKQALGGRDELSMSELEKLKEQQAAISGIYKRTGQIAEDNASSMIADASRKRIENEAENAGFDGMKEYNQIIKNHYDALKVLDKINGQSVKGGKLGSMLAGHAAGITAATAEAASHAFGGGLFGTLAAGLGGETLSNLMSKIQGNTTFTNPLRDAIIEKIEQEDPQAVQNLVNYIGSTGKLAPILQPKTGTNETIQKIAGVLPTLAARGANQFAGLLHQ